MLPQAGGPSNSEHLKYMQQFQQAQMQQAAFFQQAMMFGGMPPYPGMGGYADPSAFMGGGMQGFGGRGKGWYGKGGSKGGGKGKKGGGKGKKGEETEGGEGENNGEETERYKRPPREETPIAKAQREARERAEGDILKYLQGRWKDLTDENIRYTVEGNTCSVSNRAEPESRVFHNRLSMYGVDFCWNAKRFWHNLNVDALKAQGEPSDIKSVEWNPGKSSPPAEQIMWLRAPPDEDDATDAQKAAAASAEECSAAETTDAAGAEVQSL